MMNTFTHSCSSFNYSMFASVATAVCITSFSSSSAAIVVTAFKKNLHFNVIALQHPQWCCACSFTVILTLGASQGLVRGQPVCVGG